MARLVTQLWIDAYRRRLSLMDIPAFVTRKGDGDAGAVLVKLSTLDGQACCYQRCYDLISGDRQWTVLSQGAEGEVDQAIARQCGYDPDLWVIEVEDRAGRHLLDQDGLA